LCAPRTHIDPYATFWVEEVGRPPLGDEVDRYEFGRRAFEAGKRHVHRSDSQ
jgi:hypothetical protein